MRSRKKSCEIYESMCKSIPGGVNSPVRSCLEMGQSPLVAEEGSGAIIVDADGNRYIDYCGSWGALIHGHAHPVIIEAVKKRCEKGTSFGITTALEGELAKEVIRLMNSIEKVRFVSSGTEATMSAVRLARGFTGRDWIVKFAGNYHGHADFFLVQAGSGVLNLSASSSAGVPQEIVRYTICLPYNDVEAVHNLFNNPIYQDKIAAVIVEPVAGNMGVVPATQQFLDSLRQETQKRGALLIFDEVMTGFRVGIGGAQEKYEVQPDLTCLGKIVGGGFPAAAFGGRADIMDHLAPLGKVYQAGTLSGNPVAMEAGLQSLRLIQMPFFYENLEKKTERLVHPIRKKIAEKGWNAVVQQAGSMWTLFLGSKKVSSLEEALKIDKSLYAGFFRKLFDKGIYAPPSPYEAWFVSSAHQDHQLDETASAILSVMEEIFP